MEVITVPVKAGSIICVERTAAICSSIDRVLYSIFFLLCDVHSNFKGSLNCTEAAMSEISRVESRRFNHLLCTHAIVWKSFWQRADIQVHLTKAEEENKTKKKKDKANRDQSALVCSAPPSFDSSSSKTTSAPTTYSEMIQFSALSFEKLQFVLRLHLFHLAQVCNANNIGVDASIPARGLHGEAYRGYFISSLLCVSANN